MLQLLEDAFGGKLQNLSAFAHSVELVITFVNNTLCFASFNLGRNLWSNRRGVFTLESFGVLEGER